MRGVCSFILITYSVCPMHLYFLSSVAHRYELWFLAEFHIECWILSSFFSPLHNWILKILQLAWKHSPQHPFSLKARVRALLQLYLWCISYVWCFSVLSLHFSVTTFYTEKHSLLGRFLFSITAASQSSYCHSTGFLLFLNKRPIILPFSTINSKGIFTKDTHCETTKKVV